MGGQDWWLDVRHGVRLLVREPVVSLAMVATMVLGIGALSAVSSLVYGVMLRPLPFPDAAKIVQLARTDGVSRPEFAVVGLPDLEDWRDRSTTFAAIGGWSTASGTLFDGDAATRIVLAEVTPGFAEVFGISPRLGRDFAPDEYVPERARVTLLSHDFWRAAFGSDPQVLGRSLTIDNLDYLIVGVLPRMSLPYPDNGFDLWIPLARSSNHWSRRVRGASWLNAVGRVRLGVDIDVAEAEMARIQAQLVRDAPRSQSAQTSVALEPLRDVMARPARQTLALLSASVLGILAIACLNLAILLLARVTRRASEFAVRAALGGTSGRLRRQLLTESLVVAGLGGLMGILAAPTGLRLIVALYPGGLPRADELGLSLPIVSAAALAIVTCAVLAGILPALWGFGRSAAAPGERASTAKGARTRATLAGLQVSLSVALLVSAALFLQTLDHLAKVDPGFDPAGVTAFQVTPSTARYPDDMALNQYWIDLLQRIEERPGVVSAGLVNFAPFAGGDWGHGFTVVGEGDDTEAPSHAANVRIAHEGHYRTLRVRLARGRLIARGDDAASAPVAMLNEAAARAAFGSTDPIGAMVEFEGQARRIVGVVGDVKHRSLAEASTPEIHVPARQTPPRSAWVTARATPIATDIVPDLRSAVHATDPSVAIVGLASYEARLADATAPERFRAVLVAALGALAMVIALIGIYGTLSHVVARMVKEIGIRMALGEGRSSVVRRVLRRAVALASVGVALGLAGAWGISSRTAELLHGVDATDARTYLGVSSLVWLVCLAAALGPAVRASRLDPVAVIREE